MAKKQKIAQVSVSFHYLVKNMKGEIDPQDLGFSEEEFKRIVARIKDTKQIDFKNEDEIMLIKMGKNLSFLSHESLADFQHFGRFEGAYYGHEYRNSKVGKIDADSLNLRPFYYLLDFRRDGKIVVGAQYSGPFGDYEGLRRCFENYLEAKDFNVVSRTICSPSHEIDRGEPVELKVNIRRQNPKLGGGNLFSKAGLLAIKRSDYGDAFKDDIVKRVGPILKKAQPERKRALAELMSEGELMDLKDEDIESCTLLMRTNGNTHTIYVLGENSFATKFPIAADVDLSGHPKADQVKSELLRILNGVVTPSLRQ